MALTKKKHFILFLNTILFVARGVTQNAVVLNRTITAQFVENSLIESLKRDKGTGCDIPTIDPFADAVSRYYGSVSAITCHGRDWVRCYLSVCKVDPPIHETVKNIKCTYRDVIYVNDSSIHKSGPKRVLYGDQEYHLSRSDHVNVYCEGIVNGDLKWWGGYVAGLRHIPMKVPQGRRRTFNVLIFGFDSTSRNGFIRNMPKSYDYIRKEFGATVLNGYNIVGDGTTAALLPILTGKSELELPECRHYVANSTYADNLPLIFYTLSKDGYRTAYFEDMPEIGTFQYRFNGFKRQPADHYLRTFLREHNFYKSTARYCVGDTPQFQFMMNLTDQFFRLDGKKFAFTLIADITHSDFSTVTVADKPLVRLLKGLKDRGVLKRTAVFIMGDHGPRFEALRETLQGKLEERLPLMAIRLPDDLVKKHPEKQKALEENANVLTTPFDIYATILDIINMREHWNRYKIKGADLTRSLTILEPIPKTRSCSEAGVQPHWCSCVRWQRLTTSHRMYSVVPEELLRQINVLIAPLRHKCATRYLLSTEWVTTMIPNKRVLEFKIAGDYDGYIGLFEHESSTTINRQLFQAKITVGPGLASYEATLTYDADNFKFVVDEISRTNAYKDEPSCLEGRYTQLHPFCYCIKQK